MNNFSDSGMMSSSSQLSRFMHGGMISTIRVISLILTAHPPSTRYFSTQRMVLESSQTKQQARGRKGSTAATQVQKRTRNDWCAVADIGRVVAAFVEINSRSTQPDTEEGGWL